MAALKRAAEAGTRPARILAADVGGTHARFFCGRATGKPLHLETSDFHDLNALVRAALNKFGAHAWGEFDLALAVAGPVHGDRARFTNLSWDADAAALQKHFGFRQVLLLNDLEVAARALAEHPPADAAMLRRGVASGARMAVISIGTGLGTAFWTHYEGALHIEPAEAGHVGFAPSESWQLDYLKVLQQRYGQRISWERVLSGPGLALLDAHLRNGNITTAADVAHRAAAGDSAAVTALRRFSRMLGTYAGDLVLAAASHGGVWLIGGVLAGLGPLFDTQEFLEGFDDKGRLAPIMENVPVHRTDAGDLGVRGAWLAALGGHHAYRRELWASA